MKNLWKVILAAVFIGIALMVLGFSLGTKTQVYIDRIGIHAVDRADVSNVSKKDIAPFHNLDIDIASSNLEIIPADYYGYEYFSSGWPRG